MASILKEKIAKLLVENNIITQDKLDEALRLQKEDKSKKEDLGDILIRLGYVSRDNLLEVMSIDMGIPAIHLSRYKITPDILSGIPKKTAQNYGLFPVSRFGNTITLAMSDPTNQQALDDVKRLTSMEVRALLASADDIKDSINQYYGMEGSGLEKGSGGVDGFQSGSGLVELTVSQDEASKEMMHAIANEPVVRLTNTILTEAVDRRSSDIFIEPGEQQLKVRYRVDGLLQEGLNDSLTMHLGVVSRLKVVSKLNIAEHRLPQDGRFKAKIRGKEIDFRVSVLPSFFGEKIVLRVLDKNQAILDIEKLGFEKSPLERLKQVAKKPHGMITICGPTGSGKTTTLYSVLKLIDSPESNIVTVEDPVEFQMPGINQVSVRTEVKLTFAAALRAILRQDPDIIMVGEIRDTETADVSIKAALTGHMVLSTLHATTAAGAITRLLNMGIEPFLITSSLLFAGSQRLVRRICENCKEGYEPSPELIRQLGVNPSAVTGKKILFYHGMGCGKCEKKGYKGREVLLEDLIISPKIKNLILKSEAEYKIKEQARKEGMETLRENGIAKVLRGTTTPEEVMRITVSDDRS